jgi:hypothetical protein
MRIFEKPNLSAGWKCPICKTKDEKPVVLIGIYGTEEDGIIEAEQFHAECIDLLYYKKENILAQKISN